MKKCPFCKRILNSGSGHIYYCKNKSINDNKEIKFLYIKENFIFVNEDFIIKNYVTENKSLPDIKKEYNIDYKSILFLLDYFNIKKRTSSDSAKNISFVKYKKTCLKKYGVDNVSKLTDIKKLKKGTFIKNYGVDNIFKDENFKNWIKENNFAWNNLTNEQNLERIKKQTISIKNYWMNLTDEQKNNLTISRYINGSKIESKISEALNLLSIPYTTQYPLKGKLFDFRISNTNILIEVNGDYWHCNPNIYKKDDIINYPGIGKIIVNKIWEKDKVKKNKAENLGFIVIYIWESEIYNCNDISELIFQKLFN